MSKIFRGNSYDPIKINNNLNIDKAKHIQYRIEREYL